MQGPLEVVVLGAGSRGLDAYAPYALRHPEEMRIVAVAEPDAARRARFAERYALPAERCYASWQELTAQGQLAQAAFNCTMDDMHVESTLALLEAGYDVLLEKPMAGTLAGCVSLVQAAEHRQRVLQICHVLRYTTMFSALHEVIASGRLGDVINVEHRENVVFWHMAHSFVRGNWRNSLETTPMILAKCCHDLDILYWNMGPVRRLSSMGSLLHYRPENAPPGAPARCLDGCPVADTCPFYAPRIYLGANTSWPASVISVDTSLEARRAALETGPYGRCVYHCDNDVVDNQVVSMEFASGATGTLTMHGHSYREGRTMRWDGTRASMRAVFMSGQMAIDIHDHLTGEVEHIEPSAGKTGHGGGDEGLVASFVQALRSGQPGTLTSGRNSLESHLMAFAAEESRLTHRVIEMNAYRAQAEYVS